MIKKIKDLFMSKKNNLDHEVPKHIAIIMDGNGRWAKKRGMPRLIGHREGARRLKKVVAYCDKIGIQYLTVYAFSTENWKRPQNEVDGLMQLLLEYLKNAERELGGDRVRIRVIGDILGLPRDIQDEVKRVEKITSQNDQITLIISLNYGSRNELLHAVREIAKEVNDKIMMPEQVTEDMISKHLYTKDFPDPDLIIRTSGEMRLSNFLLWQCAYSEFYFTEVLWPDFGEEEINHAILEYTNRKRRFGGI